MKTIRVLISVVGALVMLTSSVVAQPAPPPSGSTTGVVQVNDTGTLNVLACSSDFNFYSDQFGNSGQHPQVTSSSGALAGGKMYICYVDTRSYRDAFSITVEADDFVLRESGGAVTIDAENLWVFRTHRVARTNVPADAVIPDDEGTMYSTGPGGVEWPARVAGEIDHNIQWAPGSSLNTPQQVARADSGRGISLGLEGTSPNKTARQLVVLNLNLEPGTQPGIYDTEITITIVPDGI